MEGDRFYIQYTLYLEKIHKEDYIWYHIIHVIQFIGYYSMNQDSFEALLQSKDGHTSEHKTAELQSSDYFYTNYHYKNMVNSQMDISMRQWYIF